MELSSNFLLCGAKDQSLFSPVSWSNESIDRGVPDDKPGNKRRENHTVYNERFAWWLGAYRYYLFLSFLPMLFYTTSRGNTTVSPASGYSKATVFKNHFFYQKAAAYRAEGGQVVAGVGQRSFVK